ncbi:MAG: DMT family transporter [Gammaproteobacteria bacterium]|nr:DMT family transporter [Gammaproteobacteria bacterium]
MTHALAPKLLLAALLAVAAELMFASMGATIKVLSEQLPSASVVFFRNLLGLALVLPWLLKSGTRSLGTDHPRLHILRGLAGLGAMYCFFHAIAHMPLAEAMLLKVSAPLFIPIIALLWLAEYVPNKVRWAIGVGFLGVALILRPGFAEVSPVALIALLGAVLAGLAKVTIRRLSATEPTTRIVFYFALIGTMISALPLAWHWVTPPPTAWGLLVAVGVFATAGQLLMTRAYALAPAAQVGPFTYSSVIFATAYGWLFWGELMDLVTAVGATLVIIAGVMTVRTRRQPTQKEKPKPPSEAEPASSVIR